MPSDGQSLGAHGGGIPPGWDFPEARAAAENGVDLWLLDSRLKMTPLQRLRAGARAARLAHKLRLAVQKKYAAR